jgi:hopanoid biosynthesis associated protein HpnK
VSRLIIHADDFGLTSGVNRAIAELHRAGLLTSATLMAKAEATDEAIEIARATPTLGVGCHVVLVDGSPVSTSSSLPSLTDSRTGELPPTLGQFVRRIWTGRIDAADIEAEASAQIATLQDRGLRLTHIDTHKHTHIFPAVLRPVLRAAKAAGIGAVRNPFEPAWAIRATPGAPWLRRMQVSLMRRVERTFRRIVAEEGFVTTDGAIGVLATGTLDEPTITSLLGSVPPGTWELVTHPGYNDAALGSVRTRLRESREIELEALAALQQFPSVERISFADL